MATIKYLLRNKDNSKPVSINYDIHLSAQHRLRGSLNLKVYPAFWDPSKQTIRNKVEVGDIRDEYNKKLSNFKSFVLNRITAYETSDFDVILEKLKEDISIHLGRKKVEEEEEITFYKFIDNFIEQSKNRLFENSGRKLSARTIQDYKRTKKLLTEFEIKEKYPISFDTINLEFYYTFKNYLEESDFSLNTIGKFIKIIKVFMNAATDLGVNTNISYKNRHFTKPTTKTEAIYLNIEELERIIKLDLSSNPVHDNARDLFIIGSYTGLRVSDFNGLTHDNIKTYRDKRFFQLTVKKTGKYLPIPIHPQVEKILEKNDGHPPKSMKAQSINDALSIIGEKAKIKETVTIETIKGGKKIIQRLPKYELIKNHTARRSFCTNAYIAGMSTLDIMAISGHSSEKTFLNYIKITPDERAVKIAESPFFQSNI